MFRLFQLVGVPVLAALVLGFFVMNAVKLGKADDRRKEEEIRALLK